MRHLLFLFIAFLCLSGCKKDQPEPDPAGNLKTVGASAKELLSSTPFTRLVIEVQTMPNSEPTQESLDNLKSFLEARLNKPGGIEFRKNSMVVQGAPSEYSLDEIKSIEEALRIEYNSGSTIAVYCLFADAPYSENSGGSVILGIAYRNTSVVIFEKSIQDLSGGLGQPSRTVLETTVLQHELGHLLGLVDIGSAMQTDHKDQAHGAHCDNSDCLMYYLAETGDIVAALLGGNIPQLDANCAADLKANGGK